MLCEGRTQPDAVSVRRRECDINHFLPAVKQSVLYFWEDLELPVTNDW